MKFLTSGSWKKCIERLYCWQHRSTLFKRHPEQDSMTHLYIELSSHSSPFSPSTSSSSARTSSRLELSMARPSNTNVLIVSLLFCLWKQSKSWMVNYVNVWHFTYNRVRQRQLINNYNKLNKCLNFTWYVQPKLCTAQSSERFYHFNRREFK